MSHGIAPAPGSRFGLRTDPLLLLEVCDVPVTLVDVQPDQVVVESHLTLRLTGVVMCGFVTTGRYPGKMLVRTRVVSCEPYNGRTRAVLRIRNVYTRNGAEAMCEFLSEFFGLADIDPCDFFLTPTGRHIWRPDSDKPRRRGGRVRPSGTRSRPRPSSSKKKKKHAAPSVPVPKPRASESRSAKKEKEREEVRESLLQRQNQASRKDERYAVRVQVEFTVEDGTGHAICCRGTAYNISQNGLSLITEDCKPQMGDTMRIIFPLQSDLGSAGCVLAGRVCWVMNTTDQQGTGFGVEISKLSSGDQKRWAAYVEHQAEMQAWD